MEPSQANEPARSGPALRQLSTITLGDLQNALKNMTSVVSTEQTVPNSGNGQESLSAVMGRALQVHNSMLSQLEQSETLIRELQ